MSYVFTFKKTKAKVAKIFTFIGTWAEFETNFPSAIIVSPLEPILSV
jgi:hypothetical protein